MKLKNMPKLMRLGVGHLNLRDSFRKKAFLVLLGLTSILLVAGLISRFLVGPNQDGVLVEIFDVGQGDSILIQSGDRQALIDGGPNRAALADLGRALPLFDRTLELVVLTHPHGDHADGLAQVFERYDSPELWFAAGAPETADVVAVERAAAAGELTAIRHVRRGDSFELDDRARLDVLWPAPDWAGSDDLNEYSVVLRLSLYCGMPGAVVEPPTCRRFLLMGDATGNIEKMLLETGGQLAADVLKVGHHGSRQSTTGEFLDVVRPKAAAVSVGQNSYGHPASAALRRLVAAGTEIWRTDHDGSIRFFVTAETMRIEADRR